MGMVWWLKSKVVLSSAVQGKKGVMEAEEENWRTEEMRFPSSKKIEGRAKRSLLCSLNEALRVGTLLAYVL